MSWLQRLFNLTRGDQLTRDIDRELSFHIAERADELQRSGLSEKAALREARRRLGNPTLQAERTRDADVLTWLDSFAGDVRYALRGMRRSPAFALVAIASLALGIGGNTAIYTLIDAVMVRPLPVPRPEELVQLSGSARDLAGIFTYPLWQEIRGRQSGLSKVAAFSETSFNIAPRGEARRIIGSMVSGEYFNLFGMHAAVGRVLGPADDVRGCPRVAALSNSFWRSEYGGRADVVGRTIPLDGQPFEIVGVTAGTFTGPEVGVQSRVFVPMCSAPAIRGEGILEARSNWWLRIMGRMDPALSIEQVAARIATVAPAIYAATVPERWTADFAAEYRARKLVVRSAETGLSALRTRYSGALLMLMGAVALVLLIACANVANLLLARAAARQHEVAIRRAIGAGRRRLVRQLLTESALLALLGAAVGLVFARWSSRALVALISSDSNPVALDLALNLRVLGFTALAALITVTLFGLIPAWRGTRADPQSAIKARGRGITEGHARFTIGKVLVAAQVALSLVLLVGAGLLIGSLRKLATEDPGFRADGVLLVDVDLRGAQLGREQRAVARSELLERLRVLPGVRSVSTTSVTPAGGSSWNDMLVVPGYKPPSMEDELSWFNEVGGGYFTTMETRLLTGRDFSARDLPASPKVAIVNDAAARHYFGTAAVLGRQFRTKMGDSLSAPYTIVGVVENAKYMSLREETARVVYVPATQNARSSPYLTLLIRADGDARRLAPVVRGAIAALQPAALLQFQPLARQVAASLQRERLLALLSGLFGGIALLLSVLGLYGVMSYVVARRRNEIGLRIALGAARARVLRMVLGDVTRVIAIGLVIGMAGALASGKFVKSFLYGLQPTDPAILLLAALLLATVALGAGALPAWRAAQLDPLTALREE